MRLSILYANILTQSSNGDDRIPMELMRLAITVSTYGTKAKLKGNPKGH